MDNPELGTTGKIAWCGGSAEAFAELEVSLNRKYGGQISGHTPLSQHSGVRDRGISEFIPRAEAVFLRRWCRPQARNSQP